MSTFLDCGRNLEEMRRPTQAEGKHHQRGERINLRVADFSLFNHQLCGGVHETEAGVTSTNQKSSFTSAQTVADPISSVIFPV